MPTGRSANETTTGVVGTLTAAGAAARSVSAAPAASSRKMSAMMRRGQPLSRADRSASRENLMAER